MATDGFLEEIIERCVERIANGESLGAVLASYPSQAIELRAMLAPAQMLMSARVPPVGQLAESMALNRMLSAVQAAQARPVPAHFLLLWLRSLKARPLAYQMLAIAGAAMVFGGVTLGAAAATGSTPAPVRRILRISADSEHRIVLKGAIASLGSDTLTLRIGGAAAMDVRTIALTSSTKFSRGDQRIARGDLYIGDVVEIEAAQSGERIEATVVRAYGADAPAAGATTAASDGTPAARSPATTTPGSAAPGDSGSPGSGSGDGRTPERSATSQAAGTPGPGGDRGSSGDGTATAGATATPGADKQGTPASTPVPNATEPPEATRAAESTQTQRPEHTPSPIATNTPEP